MAQVTIKINSREYAVACGEGQESHIIKLSKMLDEKAKILTAGGGHINENMLLAMVGLLLADDLADARALLANSAHVTNDEKSVTAKQEQVKTVEKIVEKFIEPDLSPLDNELAQTLSDVAKQIAEISSEIEKF